jgi:transcriptional regulator with XRE-family HTH domain
VTRTRRRPHHAPLTTDEQAYLLRVGQAVRFVRRSRGLSQTELATRTKMSRNTISRIECGQQHTLLLRIREIGAALQVPPAAIVQAAEPQPGFELTLPNGDTTGYPPGWMS